METASVIIDLRWPGTSADKRDAAHQDLLARLDAWGERWSDPEPIMATVRSQIS